MIQEYIKDDKRYFRVREFARSKKDPSIRREKSKSGIESHLEAKRISKILLREVQHEILVDEQKGWTWERAIHEWELAVREGNVFANQVTKQTLSDYLTVIRTYTSHWMHISVNAIDKAEAWSLMEKVEQEVSISRRKRLRTAIDAIFKWGILAGKFRGVSALPTEGYKTTHKEEEKMPEILTLSEIRTLLDFAKRMGHLWYPVWAVALLTGMRSGELYALEWSKVDFENKMLTVDRNWTNYQGFGPTKGRYWRAVPINDQLMTCSRN
jgi:integrase